MCGIFGTYLDPAESIERGLERLRHCGPDGSGIAEAGPARHGHVRLALLDLTTASA
jgi:asparagine synthase (glutamine-hydrolysing)